MTDSHRYAKEDGGVMDEFGPMQNTILPIQIRPDVTVLVQGIPHDLTKEEANKLEAVVMAMVMEARDGRAN